MSLCSFDPGVEAVEVSCERDNGLSDFLKGWNCFEYLIDHERPLVSQVRLQVVSKTFLQTNTSKVKENEGKDKEELSRRRRNGWRADGRIKTRWRRESKRGLGRKKCEMGRVSTIENMSVASMPLVSLSVCNLPEAITVCMDLLANQSRNIALRMSLYVSK